MVVKTAISLPEPLLPQVEEIVREDNLSRSGVIALAVERFARERENARLLERLNAVHAEGLDAEEDALLEAHRRAYHPSSEDG
jgi:metal-responsive CopG/Arc/MetJ family transcriptional regulator